MGAQTIKRDALKYQKRTRELMTKGRVVTVSIAQDTTTGEILAVGTDHSSCAQNIPLGHDGSWEIKEYQLWR